MHSSGPDIDADSAGFCALLPGQVPVNAGAVAGVNLERPSRITLPFTPTGCSWLDLEIFFGIITRQAIRSGTFTSVNELTAAIGSFADHWSDHPRPFAWTKDADEILASIHRANTKTSALTDH
jgi:hypothetical protein